MRPILLTLVILGLSFHSKAQVAFEQNVVIDSTYGAFNPQSIITADFDNDGDEDLAVASYSKVVWYKNLDGLGSFGRTNQVTTEFTDAKVLRTADFDGDNDLDLVFFSRGSGSTYDLVWSENTDGLGTFSAPVILSNTPSIFLLNLQVLDMDNDGDIDIAYSSNANISWLENTDGQATFTNHYLLGTNDGFYTIDVDGDDISDIIGDFGYDLRAYKLNANGTLSFIETMNTFSLNNDHAGADIDNDGDNDIVTFFENGNTRQVHWYENTDGLGTFANRQILFNLPTITNFNNGDIRGLKLINLDNDNLIDILTYDSKLNGMSWYKNLGNATYDSEQIISNGVDFISSVYVSDLDNDGFKDVLTSSYTTFDVSWFKHSDGQGTFNDETRITSYAGFVNHVHYGDLDGDGDLDLVSSSHADNRIAWYENTNGEGDFSNIQQVISKATEDAREAFVVDIDGDNDNDVLAYSFLDDTTDEKRLIWFENDGSGTFLGEQLIYGSTSNSFFKIDYADVNNDNAVDLMTVGGNNTILVFKNNGDGTYAVPQLVTPTTTSFAVRSAQYEDVDGDGDIDILAVHNDQMVWYENSDGSGDYTNYHIVSDFNSFQAAVAVTDIDNDNDPDIVFSNKSPDEIGYFLNVDGTATTYDPKVVITNQPTNPWVIYALDIDNDGDQDLITNSETGQKLVWYPNDGMLGFGNAVEITSLVGRVNSIDAADIDADGKIDLITSSYDDDKVAWYKNLGAFTNVISGEVRLDANADGCDPSDVIIPNLMVTADNGSHTFSTFTQDDGSYYLQANQESFTTSITSALPNYYTSNPLSHTYDFTNSNNVTSTSDFCIEASQTVNDVAVAIYPTINPPRPGFDTTYRLVLRNDGTVVTSGSVVFEFDDSKINFLNASETVAVQTSNSLTFNYIDLVPFETRTIDLEFNVFTPPTTNIDDVLIATATINPIAGDALADDNVFNLEQIVIGSYDPNDIRVLEGDQIGIDAINRDLHYIIRFQNTGTASAINVRVNSILDDRLDWSTLQLESLSHAGRVEITDGNTINFIFDGINLPDSTADEPNSHGYIAYKIKPKSDVVVGDVISATAAIYFDFNPPIITNTATTEVIDLLSVEGFENDAIQLYPNPVNTRLNLKGLSGKSHITIFDSNGRILNHVISVGTTQTLVVSELSQGIYFMQIQSGNKTQLLKFIKQ